MTEPIEPPPPVSVWDLETLDRTPLMLIEALEEDMLVGRNKARKLMVIWQDDEGIYHAGAGLTSFEGVMLAEIAKSNILHKLQEGT